MNGNWIKVVLFLLVVIMITGIVTALLDPGLGKPDDLRRTRHAAGFSIAYPLGWGGSAFGSENAKEARFIRLAPERTTGRETSINVVLSGAEAQPVAEAKPGTFQGQAALFSSDRGKRDWRWRVQFQREQGWFQITLTSPIAFDVEKSAYWPFINSFRTEKPIAPTIISPTTQAGPSIVPVD